VAKVSQQARVNAVARYRFRAKFQKAIPHVCMHNGGKKIPVRAGMTRDSILKLRAQRCGNFALS
jgi:hypothetical protein